MPKIYNLPTAVASALATNRSVLCHIYKQQIEKDDPEKAALVELIGDLIDDRVKANKAMAELVIGTKDTLSHFKSTVAKATEAASALNGLLVHDEEEV